MGKKKEKEKIRYVDDGRTIADMSNVTKRGPRVFDRNPYKPRSTAKEKWSTYWGAVRMMFVPMLVAVCAIVIVYMLMSFLFLVL